MMVHVQGGGTTPVHGCLMHQHLVKKVMIRIIIFGHISDRDPFFSL